MTIDTNGFEIGDEVYLAEKRWIKYYPIKDYIIGFRVTMLHNKQNVCAVLERTQPLIHITRLYDNEEEIIRYCDELNSKM